MSLKIIVNADDFGESENSTSAIIKAFNEGLISSTTIMANGKALESAINWAKENPNYCVGMHFNLARDKAITKKMQENRFFCDENGKFVIWQRNKKLSKELQKLAYDEMLAQLDMVAPNISLSHADSHHFTHTSIALQSVYTKLFKDKGVTKIRPHRNIGQIPFYKKIIKNILNKKFNKAGLITPNFMGSFCDFCKSKDKLKNGVCEIMVHPMLDENGVLCDAVDYINDKPVLVPMEDYKKVFDEYEMISYRDFNGK